MQLQGDTRIAGFTSGLGTLPASFSLSRPLITLELPAINVGLKRKQSLGEALPESPPSDIKRSAESRDPPRSGEFVSPHIFTRVRAAMRHEKLPRE